ncbi:hypothetical protein [Pseudoalteromonas aliena]|jgi:hypothetical protein|uniref:Uncharacterized protein n=1 Tax=Pseudoalteromonas aliena SW19 TaxID=1314866 RepID=A0ABR9E5C1_9GAMM|nr:hypothetical protein [Pseudoalteromonas aliena]MBE0361046.1 hypothetical protein [Pseudoalteromonas aliena SW19]
MNLRIKYVIAISFIGSILVYFLNTPSNLNINTSDEKLSLNESEISNRRINSIYKPENSGAQKTGINVLKSLNQETLNKEKIPEEDREVNEPSPSEVFIPFDKQEVNYEWADEFTYQLHDFFSANEQLATLKLKNVECRATLCHLQLLVSEDDSIDQAIIIANTLRSDDKWKNYSFYLIGQTDESTMTVEIGVN